MPEITLDPEPITLDEPKQKTPLFGLAKKAAARKASIGVEQTAEQYKSDIGTAKGKAASDIAQGVVLGGAALATGGLAAGPAAALMGTAGVGSAAIGEMMKAGYNPEDIPKSARGVAFKLGMEGLLSAGGEAGVRAVGQGLKYLGKEVLPALVMRSAAKAEQGQQALVRVQQDSFSQLRDLVRTKGNPTVDIGDNIVQFFGKLKERATGSSATFKESMKPIFAKFWKAAEGTGGSLEKQPLDALMEIKTDLNHIAYKTKGMNTDEMVALRDLADQIDGKIVKNVERVGGDAAKKLYTNYKAFTEQIRRDDGALSVAETGLKKLLGKTAGYIPGVDATIDGMIRGKAAPWALERLFSEEKTAALVKKAINMESLGEHRQAQVAFEAAINASDVGTLLKDWFRPEKRKTVAPAMQEAAQNLGPLSQMGP